MLAIENYIKGCSNTQAAIFGYLREIILSFSPLIEEDMSGNTPYYYLNGGLCYINKETKGSSLSFCNAHLLQDTNTLQPADTQNETHIHFNSLRDVNADFVLSILQQTTQQSETASSKLAYC